MIDTVGNLIVAFFGIASFFSWGLHLEWLQEFQEFAITFGVLSPSPAPFSYDIASALGGCFMFALGMINARALKQGLDNETDGAKAARQDVNFILFLGQLVAMTKAAQDGIVSGSFAFVWIGLSIVFTVGYAYIIITNFASIRGPMSEFMFKVPLHDKMDTFIAFLFIAYGICGYLTTSLHLNFIQKFMAEFMSLFGILEPSPGPFNYDLPTIAGGLAALSMAMVNLGAFCGAHENKDFAEVRRFGNLMFWSSAIVVMSKYPENGSFYTVWTGLSVIFVLALANKDKGSSSTGEYTTIK